MEFNLVRNKPDINRVRRTIYKFGHSGIIYGFQVYTHEDEDREQDVPNDDDNLSDIKEDLVDESNNGRPGSAGEKSDADDKTGMNFEFHA